MVIIILSANITHISSTRLNFLGKNVNHVQLLLRPIDAHGNDTIKHAYKVNGPSLTRVCTPCTLLKGDFNALLDTI